MQAVMAGGIGVLVLAAMAIVPVGNQRPAASGGEEAAVRTALGYYLEGHATGQGSAFAKVFHPESKLFFNRDGKFSQVTSAEYIARAPGKPADDEAQRRRRIDFVDVTGDAAVAKLTLEYPGVTLTDYMSLIKVDGEWRIVNKIFHAERAARSE
jgi:hypothetical protein